jgi:hypothetical protein
MKVKVTKVKGQLLPDTLAGSLGVKTVWCQVADLICIETQLQRTSVLISCVYCSFFTTEEQMCLTLFTHSGIL